MNTYNKNIVKYAVYASVLNAGFAHAAVESICPGGTQADNNVIFCESFEDPNYQSRYYDFDDDNGEFVSSTNEAKHGQSSLRAKWQLNEVEAGAFQLHFGKHPLASNIQPAADYREIYWRFYTKYPAGFVDYPNKLSRLTIMAGTGWQQAMIAHVWTEATDKSYLYIDPVSGVKNDVLVTTKWNDFANFTWLGSKKSTAPVTKGDWVCVESRVKLNDSGVANGAFELYINNQLTASKNNIDWVGAWSTYALNTLQFSNYWNGAGSPADNQLRYLDAIVVSKARIGCIGDVVPLAPQNLSAF